MEHHMAGFQMPALAQPPPLMNQPPQIFGADTYHGMPMQHLPPDLTAQMFGDPSALLDDANEAKRRRIARVSDPAAACTHRGQPRLTITPRPRPATCVGRRRSSAMESCRHVRIASITRRTASLPRSRRKEIRQRGECPSPRTDRQPDRRKRLAGPGFWSICSPSTEVA